MYDAQIVAAGLAVLWQPEAAQSATDELAAPRDMPRAAVDPSRGGTVLAVRADVARAWEHARLTDDQRRAIVAIDGLGLRPTAAGSILGASRQTVTARRDAGLVVMSNWLNGVAHDDGAGDPEAA